MRSHLQHTRAGSHFCVSRLWARVLNFPLFTQVLPEQQEAMDTFVEKMDLMKGVVVG